MEAKELQNQPVLKSEKPEEVKPIASVTTESLDTKGVEQAGADVSGTTDGPVVIIDTCDIALLVPDQPEIAIPNFQKSKARDTAQSKAEPQLLIVALLPNEPEITYMIQTCADPHPLALLKFHEPEKIPDVMFEEVYYEIFQLPDACKRRSLYQDMLYRGSDSWLFSLRFSVLLILSFYKTRGRVFSNKGGLMRTLEAIWGSHMGLVGCTQEDHGGNIFGTPRGVHSCYLESFFLGEFTVLFNNSLIIRVRI